MKVDNLFRASILDPTTAVHSARVSTINCPVASDLRNKALVALENSLGIRRHSLQPSPQIVSNDDMVAGDEMSALIDITLILGVRLQDLSAPHQLVS